MSRFVLFQGQYSLIIRAMLQIDIETLDAWQILARRRQRAWRGNAQDNLRTGRGVLDRTVLAARSEQPLMRCFSRGRGQG